MTRGVRPHIEPEQYATMSNQRTTELPGSHSPLRQSVHQNPLSEVQESGARVLRHRRDPVGVPSQGEASSNQAATIMTSVSRPSCLHANPRCAVPEHD